MEQPDESAQETVLPVADASDALPDTESQQNQTLAALQEEAERLRQGRRSYRRILAGYFLAVSFFFGWFGAQTYRTVLNTPSRLLNPYRGLDGKVANPDPAIAFSDWKRQHEVIEAEIEHFNAGKIQVSAQDARKAHQAVNPYRFWRQETPADRLTNLIGAISWPAVWSMAFWIGLPSAGVLLALRRTLKAQKKATGALGQFREVQAVGPLLEALRIDDRRIQMTAERALIALLPQVRASNADLFSDVRRDSLHRCVRSQNPTLCRAALKALEQVGDEKDARFVKRLLTSADPETVEAATTCLSFLTERCASDRLSRSLLRASSAEAAGPDVLLRPVSYVSDAAPHELLRAEIVEATAAEPEVRLRPVSYVSDARPQELLRVELHEE